MPDFIKELRFRLLERGCPAKPLRKMVQEVTDHHDDLVQAALSEGQTPAAASARADTALGNPRELADSLMVSLQRSSWLGRHRFIAFVLAPLLSFPVLWCLVLFLHLALGFALFFGWDDHKLHAASSDPVFFHRGAMAFYSIDYESIGVVALLFCTLAYRSAAGRLWILWAGVICAVYAMFIYAHVSPHNLTVGLRPAPRWSRGFIPVLILGAFYLRHHLRLRQASRSLEVAA
jgi:hypothetical protein